MLISRKIRLKKILDIAIPAALQAVLDLLSMAVSFVFIGHLGSSSISALGASITYFMYIYAVTTIFNVGTNALVSRKIGAKDYQGASRILSSILYATLLVSLPFFLLAYFTYIPFFSLMDNIGSEAQEIGISYLAIIIYMIPFFLAKVVIVAGMSASGDTRTPFKVKLFATILNIILNYLLIEGNLGFPAWGLEGAAISNLSVNILESAILAIILLTPKYHLCLLPVFSKKEVLDAFKVGFPSGLERFFTLTSMAILSIIVTYYGEKAFAGYMVGGRVEAFVYMPCFGFMVAAMSLMGQNLGAHREYEAARCIKMTLCLAMGFMGSLGLVLIIAPIFVSRPFSDDPATLSQSALYLFYIGFSQMPLAINFVLDGALRGAGVTKVTLIVNSVSIWCLRIVPAIIIGFFKFDVAIIYFIMSLETFLRSGVYWYLFQKGIWKDSYKQKKLTSQKLA